MNYRSVNDLNRCIVGNLPRLPRDIDLVVGIPRSGVLAANLIALHLNLPVVDLEGFIEGRAWSGGERQKLYCPTKDPAGIKALIVDDTVHTGGEIGKAKERVRAAGLSQRVLYVCVYVAPQSKEMVDLYFEVCPPPRVFEWNLMHHSFLDDSCMDIDGVLCRDPSREENDDGPRYRDFVAKVEPLRIPTVRVGHLVTCRLEKYRELTVAWLAQQGVKYRQLVMMDYPSKEARIAAGSHGRFKAAAYTRADALLFIESDREQAQEIAQLSGRPVFCVATGEMINPQSTVPPPLPSGDLPQPGARG
jgi:orotate phosphoribosyltransferase